MPYYQPTNSIEALKEISLANTQCQSTDGASIIFTLVSCCYSHVANEVNEVSESRPNFSYGQTTL